MTLHKSILGLALFSLLSLQGWAQHAREEFGKNRIQYREFDWVYLSGENFDIYYYDSRKAIAQDALEYLESEFDRITDMIDHPPYYKTKVFIYNSLSDLRQSNMGLNRATNLDNSTEFVKPFIEVAHLGTGQEFKEELLFKISEMMVNEMMYGGNLKDMFQSSLFMNLPEWFVSGASQYVAKGWSTEMDDYVRLLMQSKNPKRATRFTGKQAALAGQSIWNFITERYGKNSMANILNYTRLTRNEERSILLTLGISFKQLMNEWQRFYTDMQVSTSSNYVNQDNALIFAKSKNPSTEFTTLKISPDGNYIAFAENDRGSFAVRVRSLTNGKERTILRGGSKVVNQRVDYQQPLISWSDENTLGVIGVKHGEYVFWMYDLKSKSKQQRALEKFSNIRSFSFSSNGRLIVLSADFEGKSDLFLLSARRERVRRLTNDNFDDLDPVFIPGTNKIVFSSNRTTDSIKAVAKANLVSLSNNYNLYAFDLDSSVNTVTRLTNTVSKDFAPLALDGNNVYYLSDQRGIINLFKFNRATGIYTQVTNFANSIQQYDLNFKTRSLLLVTTEREEQVIYFNRDFNIDQQIFTPPTRRKEIQQARSIRAKKKPEEPQKGMSVKDLLNARLKEFQEQDTIPENENGSQKVELDSLSKQVEVPLDSGVVDTDNYVFEEEPAPAKTEQKKEQDIINTDNYVFEDDAIKKQPAETFLSRYMKSRERSRVSGPHPYESKFSSDNLTTQFAIDPIRKLSLRVETQMNDMLENYRFKGGFLVPVSLRGGDFYGEFQYLPKKVDIGVRFDRQALRYSTRDDGKTKSDEHKYVLNRLEFNSSLPITDRIRISAKPFAAITSGLNLTPYEAAERTGKPIKQNYGGIKLEAVYDNSVSSGMNLIEGTRAKVMVQHYQGLTSSEANFAQFTADVRHYQKLYRAIVFAVRGYAGSFFGNSPKIFMLGGMDNSILQRTKYTGVTSEGQPNPLATLDLNNDGQADLNPDILFMEYVTNLRGFRYGSLFGNKVVMLNAELRLPIVRALSRGPISSNFLRHLQFVGFYDVGTSWSGKAPFGKNSNSISYEVIKQGPFEIEVKDYLNPWLYSYGVGMRTMILGIYVKGDVAWAVESYKVQKPRLELTLGIDF
jgi:Tol biopolymer transport system component